MKTWMTLLIGILVSAAILYGGSRLISSFDLGPEPPTASIAAPPDAAQDKPPSPADDSPKAEPPEPRQQPERTGKNDRSITVRVPNTAASEKETDELIALVRLLFERPVIDRFSCGSIVYDDRYHLDSVRSSRDKRSIIVAGWPSTCEQVRRYVGRWGQASKVASPSGAPRTAKTPDSEARPPR